MLESLTSHAPSGLGAGDTFPQGNSSADHPDYLEFDTSKIPYFGNLERPPLWETVTKIFFYSVIMLMSLVGNTLVVYIVWRNRTMRTTTNFFIVNLAVSDLMVTCSCTWVHLVDDLTEGWVLGAFFCKFNSFAQGETFHFDFVLYFYKTFDGVVQICSFIH